MAKQPESSKQTYSEFFQDRESVKQVVKEHMESNHVQEQFVAIISSFHKTNDYRESVFKLIEEYKTNRIGRFIRDNFSTIFTTIVTVIVTLIISSIYSNWNLQKVTPQLTAIEVKASEINK